MRVSGGIDPDSAFDVLDDPDTRFVVVVNDGEAGHFLDRDRYGAIVLNTWIPAIRERRTLPVTRKQARRLIVAGHGRDAENTLRIETRSDTPFEREEADPE